MLGRASTTIALRKFSRKIPRKPNETDLANIVKFVRESKNKENAKPMRRQLFSNFLVVDFEATCNRTGPKPEPQEIIEFPVLNLCATTFEEVSRFHSYVRPDVHPELSDFCTELTGIIQGMIDGQPNLKEVLERFEVWLDENNLNEHNAIPITYGDWDIASALRKQCTYLGIGVPPVFEKWVNLKYPIFGSWGAWPRGLNHSLEKAGLTFQGRAHSGIDDCRNIAQLVKYLGERNWIFKPTAKLKEIEYPQEKSEQLRNENEAK